MAEKTPAHEIRKNVSIEEATAKFSGRTTDRSICAAARMVKKGRTVKIPGHLWARFTRLTGGAMSMYLCDTNPLPDHQVKIRIGDLEVVFEGPGPRGRDYGWLVYRGTLLCYVHHWNDLKKAGPVRTAACLGATRTPGDEAN